MPSVFLPTSCRPPVFSRFRSIQVPDSLPLSESGALSYVSGGVFPQDRWSIVWVDRTGKPEPLNVLAGRTSPAPVTGWQAGGVQHHDGELGSVNLRRRSGLVTRLPMDDDQSIGVWTPDSSSVVFSSGFSGTGGTIHPKCGR
jgi:hypothetical protein